MNTTTFATLPAIGAALAAGTFAGITTLKDGTHAAIVLLPSQATATRAEAISWAESQGGQLPTRAEAAQLYAHAKQEFTPRVYWTADNLADDIENAPGHAWGFGMDGGGLNYHDPSAQLAACAVQLLAVVWGEEPVTVEAVATVKAGTEGHELDWLVEGGIAALEVGQVLVASSVAITGEDGDGVVYRSTLG